ncbi:MAG: S9 family peptidase [Halioglobus sp.]|nr:S9 family peptidase [Halioglobus sp.]MBP6725269.1 S9 family peptidase [Halioglobus sp.]
MLVIATGLAAAGSATEVKDMKQTLAYGSWPSPISAASVVEGSRGLGALSVDGDYLYWVESRPEEGGRNTIMRRSAGGKPEEILPRPWNARTRVQEYGGRNVLVADGTIWFSNFQDQRLYRMVPGGKPQPVTPAEALRYAGCVLDRARGRLLCVREDHRGEGEPRNTLVALPLEGVSAGEILFADSDFVSAPSLSPDGSRLAFTSWNHPNMPWDSTSLWSAELGDHGQLAALTRHNSGEGESLINPQWSADNQLYAISDRDNWWKIYRVEADRFSAVETGISHAEIGGPEWSIGGNYYHLLQDGKILAQLNRGGVDSLVLIDPTKSSAVTLPLDSAAIYDFLPAGARLFVINATAAAPPVLLETDLAGASPSVIRTSRDTGIGKDWIPEHRLVSFPSGEGGEAHGIYLPPTNPGVLGPAHTAPPLIVTVHGGPTAVSSPTFQLSQLYWTSRGFAILDLNYRGSTGFGRDYRRSLYGQWGIFDVEDAVAGANWLASKGLAHPGRLIISGGSAGGYTTLAALAFHDTFAAGASYFGVSDVEALARDTHKFESRYLDQLIGPYPERRDLYRERSPIHHLDGFKSPLLLLQGLDDHVVPPNQSEMIFEALKSRGIPTAYLAFEGEGHGFRKAGNQIRSLEAELYFYSRVLGFDTADTLPPVAIEGLDSKSPGDAGG